MCADGLRSIRQGEPGRPFGSVLSAFEAGAQTSQHCLAIADRVLAAAASMISAQ